MILSQIVYRRYLQKYRPFFRVQQRKLSNIFSDFIFYGRGNDMGHQKSQVLIEFALIFPLFLLLVFGIFYFSSIFSDYMTLNTIARNSAREAAVVSAENDTERNVKYMEIRNRYAKNILPLDIYTWDPSPDRNDTSFNITHQDHNVVVNINATMNQNGSMLETLVDGLSGNKTDLLNLSITYTMYSEDNKK